MNTSIATTFEIQLPASFIGRAGKLSDSLIALDLINAYSRFTNGRDRFNDPELIRLDWLSTGFRPEADLHMVFSPDGNLAGFCETWLIKQPPVHPWTSIFVHPHHLENGIWEYLLAWAENHSRPALARVPADLRVSIMTGTEHNNLAGIRAIQRLGWGYLRSSYHMLATLDSAPEVPSTPAGIQIRRFDPATETEAVYHANVDAFRDHWGFVEQPFELGFEEFKHGLIDAPGYDPNYWFVAMDGKEIAGICLCQPVSYDDNECGWVNELGVLRPWRNRGLGFILLKKAFAAFYARGQKRAGLGVDASSLTGAVRLYERAGMKVDRQFDQFEKELRSGSEIMTQELS